MLKIRLASATRRSYLLRVPYDKALLGWRGVVQNGRPSGLSISSPDGFSE